MRLLESCAVEGVRLTEDFHESKIPQRYAILSHTWVGDDDEVTFRDLEEKRGTSKAGWRKIQFCALQAERDGIQFFWIDTCCIDKSDSNELSRAINSMFRWYSRAEKCYVYLGDVPRALTEHDTEARDWELDFSKSRWFERGWTLQELLAPASVDFFTRHGDKVGNKTTLERQIRDATNIPVRALRGSPFSTFTKEERFSWQQSRRTKEEEDLIYSLLGMFDVSMPVIYGEGKQKARRRLEQEIDRASKGEHLNRSSHAYSHNQVLAAY